MHPAEVLRTYFAETIGGDMDAVDRHFVASPRYVLVAENSPELCRWMPWVGLQTDREGIKRAYGMLLDALEVVEATPGPMIEQGEEVAARGIFSYRVRATGKAVESAWSVHAVVRDDRIVEYRFYEDSFATATALRD